MSSFMLAVSVVMPMMIYMIVGGIIRKLQIISPYNFKEMNTMVFRIFIPLALFFDIYESNLGDAIQGKVFLFVFCGIMTFYIGSWFVFTKWIKEPRDAATMIQNAYRSNYVLFGAMLADSLGGNTARAQVAGLAAMVVPLINMLSVILFEVKTGQNIKPWPIIKSILKNPLVDAGILGIFMNLTGLKLPVLLAKPLCTLGDMATPLALVVLGGMLSAESMMSHKRYLTVAVICRLILAPVLSLLVAVGMGIRGEMIVVILAIFGSPTAVASVPMAQTMGGNGTLAGEIVVVTTVGSILSIFLFVFALSGMGLI